MEDFAVFWPIPAKFESFRKFQISLYWKTEAKILFRRYTEKAWGFFSRQEFGLVHIFDEIMNRFKYLDIIKDMLYSSPDEEIRLKWTFEHKDPDHTSKLLRKKW